jgi:threonine synthase
MLAYEDTRGLDPSRPSLTQVILAGIADGGGLYVPTRLPSLPEGWVKDWSVKSYPAKALELLELFEADLDAGTLAKCTVDAYARTFDHPQIAPVTTVAPGRHLLELFHGPTFAFKDMALQLMPQLFSEAIRKRRAEGAGAEDYLILVATSGDTGKAALEGFRDREFTGIVVLYPKEGVSPVQELQMVTQEGANVAVFAVDGDFDAAQAAAKGAFGDESFRARLAAHGIRLSSANSINWGRVLPQIAYYISGYADMVRLDHIRDGEPIDVAVPTGNFGNILAGYYARAMGVPIARLICASNENQVLADFLATGVYDVGGRSLVRTPSPSMDILVSSNLERLLFEASGRDAARVRTWMGELAERRQFQPDAETLRHIREVFVGGHVSNDETLQTIREVWESHERLLDPHTAVAWKVAERLARERPVLIVATAHWAKFGPDVYRALAGLPAGTPIDDEPAGGAASDLFAFELLDRVVQMAPGAQVPPSLASVGALPTRFGTVIAADAAAVEGAIEGALDKLQFTDRTQDKGAS